MMSGTYVAVVPTPPTYAMLAQWAEINRVDLNDALHVTLLCSRNVIDAQSRTDIFYHAEFDEFAEQNGKLVAKLICPELVARHAELMSKGGTHDFPTFILHMTICDAGVKHPAPIPFTMTFYGEYNQQRTPK